jgi:hypothetical protein
MSDTVINRRAVARPTHLSWRSAPAAAVAASLLLVGCGSDDSTPATQSSDDRASTSATSETRATSMTPATSEAPAASLLEGTWRTEPISLRDAEATLRRQGFAKWIERFHKAPPFSMPTVLDLSIEGGQWNLYGESEGGREPIDYDAEYEIDGDTVTFHHSDGSTTHRWTVDGDTLSLEFVTGTMPPYDGIPDEVFQRALYMTEVFTRQGG